MTTNDSKDSVPVFDKQSRKSLQVQLHDCLEAGIRQGLFPIDGQLPSLRKLGEQYGVSRETANLAVARLQEEGYLEVVPGRGAYVVSREGGSSKKGDDSGDVNRILKGTVGVLIDLGEETGMEEDIELVYDQLLRGFDLEAAYREAHILTSRIAYSGDGSRNHMEALAVKVDGIIVLGLMSKALYYKLLGLPIPVVSVMANIDVDEIDDVGIANRKSWRKTAHWLSGTGHRNLLYLDGAADYFQGRERFLGCREAAEGIHYLSAQGWGAEDSRIAFSNYVRSLREAGVEESIPDAVLAVNDICAMGVLQACRELDVRVPEDISIVGGKNSMVGLNTEPQLTTVDCHFSELARIGIDRLYGRIHERVQRPVKIEVAGSIIERGSTRDRK